MKQAAKFLITVAVAIGISALASTALADTSHLGSAGSHASIQGARYHGGGGYGGYHGGGWGGGWHGGYYGHGWGWGWGWGGWWYPYWGVSLAYSPYYPYYYNGYYYAYPPTTYYAPPAVYGSQATYDYNSSGYVSPAPPAAVSPTPPHQPIDKPLSPTAVDRDTDSDSTPPSQSPSGAQRPTPMLRVEPGQSSSVADIKALAKAGLSDNIILSHIRNSQAVYHLTTAEIIDLKNSGVSEKVIDFMINTPSAQR